MIGVNRAIDIFVQAYAYQRSFTRPVEVVHLGSLRVIRDVPAGKVPGGKDHPRKQEIAVLPGVTTEEVLDTLADYHPAGGYRLAVFATTEPKNEVTRRYKRYGYRSMGAEPLLAFDLTIADCGLPIVDCRWVPRDNRQSPQVGNPQSAIGNRHIRRIQTPAEIERVLKASRARLCRPEHLTERPGSVRAYYVEQDGRVVAWGRSIQRRKSAAYVAGLYTIEAYRRQGIASALMQRLLADDAAAGAHYSVLLASGMGYPLYQRLGYVLLGWLHLFTMKPGNG